MKYCDNICLSIKITLEKGSDMSIFSNILEKLGIHKPAVPSVNTKPAQTSTPPTVPSRPSPMGQNRPGPILTHSAPVGVPMPAKPAEMPMVDVVSKLENLAKANPQQLDWKVSIVDLLKLLGLDASAAGIKELAVELSCPESEMVDSYKRNVWTHKALLKKIAENGGNIPQNLLH
jgi:hypothetical protein